MLVPFASVNSILKREIVKLDVCQCKIAYCPGCFASWGKCVYCFKRPEQGFILNKLHMVNDFMVSEIDVLWNEINGDFIACCSIFILIILFIF